MKKSNWRKGIFNVLDKASKMTSLKFVHPPTLFSSTIKNFKYIAGKIKKRGGG